MIALDLSLLNHYVYPLCTPLDIYSLLENGKKRLKRQRFDPKFHFCLSNVSENCVAYCFVYLLGDTRT